MEQETSQPRQAMMSAVWEGPCNYIFCAVRTNMKLQAWQTSAMRSRLGRRTPLAGSGGRGAGLRLWTPPWLSACRPPSPRPSSWPGRAPHRRADGSSAGREQESPRDLLAENQESFPLSSPGLLRERQVKSENKALDATACSTVSHKQNRSDQLVNKSLQRDWREPGSGRGEWKSLPISRKSVTKKRHLILNRAGRSYF